jgi:hypothetical protein
MQDLMTKQELDLFGFEHVNESAVVIEMTSVCGCGTAPFVSVH